MDCVEKREQKQAGIEFMERLSRETLSGSIYFSTLSRSAELSESLSCSEPYKRLFTIKGQGKFIRKAVR